MADRTEPGFAGARVTEEPNASDEDLEAVFEDVEEEAPREEANDVEQEIENAIAEEVDGEAEATEAAIESELEIEGRATPSEDALVDVLLRRSGVLPETTAFGTLDEETELPPPRHADEFVCSSCFLIKPHGQLADPAHRLCRDCADAPHSGRAA